MRNFEAKDKANKIETKKLYNAMMINLLGKEILNYRNKKFKENEFFFDYLKKDAKKTPKERAVSHRGLFVNTGFGSHGYTTAPLAARLLVAQIEATPMPLGDKITQAIAPNRFLVRQLIRG